MKKIYLILLLFFLYLNDIQGQCKFAPQQIEYNEIETIFNEDSFHIKATLNFIKLKLGSQQMAVITPILKSKETNATYSFTPIILIGKKRYKALKRDMALGSYHFDFSSFPPNTIIADKYIYRNLRLNLKVPFQSWHKNSELIFQEQLFACSYNLCSENEKLVQEIIAPPKFEPQYHISYITPPAEPVKARSETHSARLNFQNNRYLLLYDYMNNAQVLDEVYKIIHEIKDNSDLSLTELKVTGYASPEGNYQNNYKLSENRARSLADFLVEKFYLDPSIVSLNWVGEDWDGLYQMVKQSDLEDKYHIMSLIDKETDNANLKRRLQILSGGRPYRILSEQYFPILRRNEYTISYIARPFNLEEAKKLVKTRPQHLSLNEMFLVANSYPKESSDFKEVFDIAVRLYPESPIAEMNSATLDLENGAIHKAIERLTKVDLPEAWNNLGIAYIRLEDFNKAKNYFKKAAQYNEINSKHNLEQLEKWLKENQP